VQEICILPGRARLKSNKLYHNKPLARYLNTYIDNLYGVKYSNVNHNTASILILFDPQKTNLEALKQNIEKASVSEIKNKLSKLETYDRYHKIIEKRDKAKRNLIIFGLIYIAFKIKSSLYGKFSLSCSVKVLQVASAVTIIGGYPLIKSLYKKFAKNIPTDSEILLNLSALTFTLMRESSKGVLVLVLKALSDYIEYSAEAEGERFLNQSMKSDSGMAVVPKPDISKTDLDIYKRVKDYQNAITPVSIGAGAAALIFSRNIMHALSVLLALTPGAAATALNSGQKSYITLLNRHKTYLRNPNIIEKLARADHIVFDKTGTLTDEIMKIETVLTYDERYSENDLLAICAACESGSMHPISVTLQKKAEGRFDSSKVKSSSLLPSKGVVASYEDYVVAIGNKDLMLERNVDIDKEMPLYSDFEQKLFTPVFVSIDNKLCGMIVMKDIIKKDAYEMIKRIKEKGIRNISILTGDNQNKALALASELGISSVYSNCSFEEKERIIEKLKSQETVIMVGDGINDAEAMRAADVSISFVNSSADIIKLHSDCIIFENDMTLLADIIPLSVKAYESIHQSITFSQIYNLVWGGMALFGNVDAFAAKAINTINSLAILLMDKRIEYLRVNRDKGTG
jgi:P-type E1-E2 ATPase